MKLIKFFWFPIFALILLNRFLPAQEVLKDSIGIFRLSPIVVTATKTSTSLLELANSITIIDSAELANKRSLNLFDLLRSEYGLSYTQQSGAGSLSQIYLRGGSPSHTLVLLDGIEVNMPNDPSNTYDFSALSLDNVERIEILRGPQSTLYGSDALAGVINVITKMGTGHNKFFVSSEAGTFNTFKLSGGINGSLNNLRYSASISKMKTDGFSSASEKYGNTEKDGAERNSFAMRAGYSILPELDLNFAARFTKADIDYDQFGGEFGDDPTYVFHLEEGSYRAEAKYKNPTSLFDQTVGVSFHKNLRKYSYDSTLFNPSSSHSLYDGRKLKFDWQGNLFLTKNNTITLGAETEEETVISEFFSSSLFGDFESVFPKTSSRTSGIYIQSQNRLNNIFSSIGIRLDKHEKFGTAFTYRIAPAYILWSTGTKLKATLGTGFKAPSLFYLFDPAFGNPDLLPEKSFGFDIGIEQYFWSAGINIGVNYFQNNFSDLFGFDENFKTININKAETRGIEFYGSAFISKNIEYKVNYTYTEAKDRSESSSEKDLTLIRRPKHKAAFNLNYQFSNAGNANIEMIYVGDREDKDFSKYPAERVILKSYLITNIYVSYKLFEMIELFGRIENLFDNYYEQVLGYASPGRAAYGGIKVSL
jgi:vitamin B12 transporter